jgi:hypothetical protein
MITGSTQQKGGGKDEQVKQGKSNPEIGSGVSTRLPEQRDIIKIQKNPCAKKKEKKKT